VESAGQKATKKEVGLSSDWGQGIIVAGGQGLDGHACPLGDGVEAQTHRPHRRAAAAAVRMAGVNRANGRGDVEHAQLCAQPGGKDAARVGGALVEERA